MTHPDFSMYEMFWAHSKLAPDTMKKFPELLSFMARIEALPRISEYVKSEKFLLTPLNNKMAGFGHKPV